jgi:AAA domain
VRGGWASPNGNLRDEGRGVLGGAVEQDCGSHLTSTLLTQRIRCESVCIAKGQSFLGRPTEQSEVLLCSLEDPRQHVDNCLEALGYDLDNDARIHIVSRLARDVTETVDAIADVLARNQRIRFVVLDTLAKVLRAKDSKDYDEMLALCEQLHLLARESKAHIQALAHCKKIQHDDPFDNFLGSVEIRAESDTNIVLYDHRGKRLIKSETRMGIPWDDPRELCADTVTVGKAKIVTRFYLGNTLSSTTEQESVAHEKNTRSSIKSRIVSLLKERGGEAPMTKALDSITGNDQMKFEMRDELISDGVIDLLGVPRSTTNPLKMRLLKPDWTPGLVIANPSPDGIKEQLRRAQGYLADMQEAKENCIRGGHGDGRPWDERIQQAQAKVTEIEVQMGQGVIQ